MEVLNALVAYADHQGLVRDSTTWNSVWAADITFMQMIWSC